MAALEDPADEKLTDLALRLVLADHVGIPHENEADVLSKAEATFVPKKDDAGKREGCRCKEDPARCQSRS